MCLPTLSASALTKRYLTEREKKKESAKTLSTSPLERYLPCIWLVLVRTQVCLIWPYFSPPLFENKFTKPSLFWDVDDIKCIAEFLWLISVAVTRIRSGDDILTWQHALQTPRIPRAATRRCLSLPSIRRTPGNTDCETRITLTSRGRPQSTEGRCICTSAATGIFNMQG